MRLETLPFEVDCFRARPGRAVEPRATFLTHAHADHLAGLSTAASPPIYCTAATAALAALRTGAPGARFRHLALRTPTPVRADRAPHETVATVTALPANHCLGAAMFVFDGPFGRVLHTGDFRYGGSVPRDVLPYVGTVDLLLLDCTYGHPTFDFMAQPAAIDLAVRTVQQAWRHGDGDDVFIGGDALGKEELYAAVADACRSRVLVDHARYKVIAAADPSLAAAHFAPPPPDASPKCHLLSLPCAVPGGGPGGRYRSAVRVVPWWAITAKSLRRWAARTGRGVTAVLPTACPSRLRPESPGVHMAYSSHSSFRELREFVRLLRPRRLTATPETSQFSATDGLCRDPSAWFGNLRAPPAARAAPASRVSLPREPAGRRSTATVDSNGDDGLGPPAKRRRSTAPPPTERARPQQPPSARLLELMLPALHVPVARLVRRGRTPRSHKRQTQSAQPGAVEGCSSPFRAIAPDAEGGPSPLAPPGLVDKGGVAVTSTRSSVWF
jgi:DNA cross-link repair 1B protein